MYLLLIYVGKLNGYANLYVLPLAIAGLTMIYLLKYFILKFTGWVTGFKQEADTYIFIVFLINKIVSVCLIPVVVIMAFSDQKLAQTAVLISLLMIAFMLLMRFIRSYSLLQNRLNVSRLHFLIYITGIEIVPLLVIYKLALFFVSKKM